MRCFNFKAWYYVAEKDAFENTYLDGPPNGFEIFFHQ